MKDISINRLFDGKLSCVFEDEEFYILPAKKECTPEDLQKCINNLLIKFDEQKEKDITEAIEQELGKRKEEKLSW